MIGHDPLHLKQYNVDSVTLRWKIEFRQQAGIEQQEREGEIIEEDKKQEFLRTKKDMEYNFKSLLRALERHPQDLETLKSLKSNSATNYEGSSVEV